MDTKQPINDALVRSLTLPEGMSKVIFNDSPNPVADPRRTPEQQRRAAEKAIRDFVPGFGVRVTAGAKTFVLRYRADGRDRIVKIGTYGDAWSVAAARAKAAELRRAVDGGADPQAEKAKGAAMPTLDQVFAIFVDDFTPHLRKSTMTAYKAQYANHVAKALGKRKIAKIEHADLQVLHRTISTIAPTMANRVAALLSRLFSFAVRRQLVSENPARGLRRNQEKKRKQYLTPDKVRRLLDALPTLRHEQSADAIRLLLLTGARRMEVLSATWDQFDMKAGQWTKPGATTKQRTDHHVPLSSAAMEVLARMAERTGGTGYLCPGPSGHQTDLKNAWQSIRKRADLPDVRLHDLRHSFASFLASGGASLPMIGALLGHTQPATTQRYAHLFNDAQRAATDRVGALVDGIARGETAEVKELRRGAS